MEASWRATPALSEFLGELFARDLPPGVGQEIVPLVIWSLGGTMQGRNEDVVRTIPARYSVGWIKREDIERFPDTFQHPKYGIVAFRPSDVDKGVRSKLLDYKGGEIVAVADTAYTSSD